MIAPAEILGGIAGGRVLDVATGPGGFIHFLLEGLKDYTEIVGVDASERGAAAFAEAFKGRPGVRFQVMDALHLDFDDSSFDMACISNSLHHLEPLPVLAEMLRVLRPGGWLVVAEMHRDDPAPARQMHVDLHHWWAAVDTACGVVHRQTYRRAEIIEMVSGLGLADLRFFDLPGGEGDPRDPAIMAELNPVIDRYIQRAAGHPDLQARGENLRQRLAVTGFANATTLLALGQKAAF